MRLTRLVGTICALCLMTGLIIYGGIFLWPQLAGSAPSFRIDSEKNNNLPSFVYSIGDATGPTRPNAVVVDKNGRIYVTDGGSGQIYVFAKSGKKKFVIGKKGTGKEQFGFPNGVVITSKGNIMVSDSLNNDIKLFTPNGKFIKTVFKQNNVRPGYLSKGLRGEIYVSDLLGNKIIVINEQGKVLRSISDALNPLKYPQATALDKVGRLWVADSGNYKIKIFNEKGKVVRTITSGGNPETTFSMVKGIVFDKTGKVYVSDTIAHQIRVFDKNGKQLFVFPATNISDSQSSSLMDSTQSGISNSSSQFTAPDNALVFPTNMFIDSNNKIYIVDRGTGNIKVFSY